MCVCNVFFAQAIRLKFVVPPTALITTETPRVAWWDGRNKDWCEEGISEIAYDVVTRTLTYVHTHSTHRRDL